LCRAIGSGGVPVTFVTIFVILFFWSLPQAFMSAELSLMMNANGGNILWVQNAFGEWGISMVISSILANFGGMTTGMAQLSWTVWAMSIGIHLYL